MSGALRRLLTVDISVLAAALLAPGCGCILAHCAAVGAWRGAALAGMDFLLALLTITAGIGSSDAQRDFLCAGTVEYFSWQLASSGIFVLGLCLARLFVLGRWMLFLALLLISALLCWTRRALCGAGTWSFFLAHCGMSVFWRWRCWLGRWITWHAARPLNGAVLDISGCTRLCWN
jgi:hypothetical protein